MRAPRARHLGQGAQGRARAGLGLALTGALLVVAWPDATCAAVVRDDPVIITTVSVGIVGGVTTTVATLVYAVEARTFHSPWIVASLFSSAVCAAMSVAIIADGANYGLNSAHMIGLLFFGSIAALPAYWSVRTALADVEPGEPLDGADLEASLPRTQDPFREARSSGTGPRLVVPLVALTF